MRRICVYKRERGLRFSILDAFALFPYYGVTCIVKHYKCLSVRLERESVGKINNFLCINRFAGAEPFKTVISVNYPKDVVSFGFFDRNVNVFFAKLSPVKDIALRAEMRLAISKAVDNMKVIFTHRCYESFLKKEYNY